MTLKRYCLHIVFNFLVVLFVLQINLLSINRAEVLSNDSALLFFISFYILFLLLLNPKNKIIIRNLDQKIRYVSLTFIYSFLFTLILSKVFYKNFEYNIEFLALYIFLYLVLSVLNILILNNSINFLDIHIIGKKYSFTQTDFVIMRDLKLDFHIDDTIESYKNRTFPENKRTLLLVNNSQLNKSMFFSEVKNHETNVLYLNINDFLQSTIRKSFSNMITYEPYNKISYILKRFIDFLVIVFFIPILIIAIPVSYIVVKSQSRGSFIYIQNRIGRNSRLFKIYKIRTMHSNHNDTDIALDKDDPRIFRYGKFLRRSRLDELPQFINVIKGDMHIAGPRAEWDHYHDLYLNNIEQYELRNIVSPGITGFAQVMFRYAHNEEDSREKLMFDLYYIKNWSIWLEMEIGIKTVQVMINKKGI